jgi:glycogen operon protein
VFDIGWFTPQGEEMGEEDWGERPALCIGIFLNGKAIPTPDLRGERVEDDSFYLMVNAHYEVVTFELPPPEWGTKWTRVLDTASGSFDGNEHTAGARAQVDVESRSLSVWKRSEEEEGASG